MFYYLILFLFFVGAVSLSLFLHQRSVFKQLLNLFIIFFNIKSLIALDNLKNPENTENILFYNIIEEKLIELDNNNLIFNEKIKNLESLVMAQEKLISDKNNIISTQIISIENSILNIKNRFLFNDEDNFKKLELFFEHNPKYNYSLIKKYIELTPLNLVKSMDFYNMKRTLKDIWKELIHHNHYYHINFNGKDLHYFYIYNINNNKKYNVSHIQEYIKKYDHKLVFTDKIDNIIVPAIKKICNIQYNFINGYKNKDTIQTVYIEGDKLMKNIKILKII